MKKLWMLFVSLMVSAMLLTSCAGGGGGAAAPPATSNTLRVAVANFGNESFDPIVNGAVFGGAIYDAVVTYAADGSFAPSLAESWTLSPDGKTWTFKVRKNVTFSNGDPLTSADFAWNLTRFMDKSSTNPWSPGLVANFDSQSTPDPYTWVVVTKTPEWSLLVSFAALQILPMNYFNKVGVDAFRKAPIGTGAYKVVNFTSGQSLTLAAVKNNWRVVPAFDNVIISLVPEEATRVAMLKTGAIDIAPVSIDDATALKSQGYALQGLVLPNLPNIAFSGTWETTSPISDIRVRQAMSYSINRQELADTLFKGFAKPGGTWFMNESTWGWDPSWKPDPYDVAKAKQLLADAGYPSKFQDPTVTLYSTVQGVNSWLPDFVQAVAGYWQAVGIQVKIVPVDYAKLSSMFFVRGSQGIIGTAWPYVSASVPNNIYQSRNMYTSNGVHTTGNDPKEDALFTKMLTDTDPKQALQDFRAFQNYGHDMYVVLGTVEQFDQMALSPAVGKFNARLNMGLYFALADIQHK